MTDTPPTAGERLTTVEPSIYDAAIDAVERIASGVPSWLVTMAVNAALAEQKRLEVDHG